MASASPVPSRTTRIWIVVLVALTLVSFIAMRRSLGRAMRMTTATTVAASSAELKPGDETKAVVELTRVAAGASLEGTVLKKLSETDYQRTGNVLQVAFDRATPVVMGKAPDVHSGAVVHVTAKMGNDHVLHASQIVILTGYVKVQ